jgi:hypothetical protein
MAEEHPMPIQSTPVKSPNLKTGKKNPDYTTTSRVAGLLFTATLRDSFTDFSANYPSRP